MAIQIRFQSLPSGVPLFCLLAVLCLVRAHSLPQEKPFQSENDLIDNAPKLPLFSSHSDLDIAGSNDIGETPEGRVLKMISALERKNMKIPPTWINALRLYQSGQHKRQIRYQQCYFNPISCF